jgi:hypothetical protein
MERIGQAAMLGGRHRQAAAVEESSFVFRCRRNTDSRGEAWAYPRGCRELMMVGMEWRGRAEGLLEVTSASGGQSVGCPRACCRRYYPWTCYGVHRRRTEGIAQGPTAGWKQWTPLEAPGLLVHLSSSGASLVPIGDTCRRIGRVLCPQRRALYSNLTQLLPRRALVLQLDQQSAVHRPFLTAAALVATG